MFVKKCLLQIMEGPSKQVSTCYRSGKVREIFQCENTRAFHLNEFCLTLKAPITTAADGKFCHIFLNVRKIRYDNS